MAFTLSLPQEYAHVVFASVAIIVECFIVGAFAGRARTKIFTQEFLEKNFGDEHKKYTKQAIKKGGYPDCGDGLYSEKLSYKNWYEFNNAQRTHMNFVENIFIIVPLILVSGYVYPSQATNAGVVYFIGRFLYSAGYRMFGPKGRLIGAGLNILSMLALIIMSGLVAYDNFGSKLGEGYGYTILATVLILLQSFLAGGAVSGARGKTFPLEKLNKAYGAQHKEAFGTEITHPGGYPDMGNGRYAKLLNYKEWFQFNNTQRSHLNGIETVGLTAPLVLITGASYNCYGAVLGFVYFAGRLLYSLGYKKYGPKGRLLGIVFAEIALFVLIGFVGKIGYDMALAK